MIIYETRKRSYFRLNNKKFKRYRSLGGVKYVTLFSSNSNFNNMNNSNFNNNSNISSNNKSEVCPFNFALEVAPM